MDGNPLAGCHRSQGHGEEIPFSHGHDCKGDKASELDVLPNQEIDPFFSGENRFPEARFESAFSMSACDVHRENCQFPKIEIDWAVVRCWEGDHYPIGTCASFQKPIGWKSVDEHFHFFYGGVDAQYPAKRFGDVLDFLFDGLIRDRILDRGAQLLDSQMVRTNLFRTEAFSFRLSPLRI